MPWIYLLTLIAKKVIEAKGREALRVMIIIMIIILVLVLDNGLHHSFSSSIFRISKERISSRYIILQFATKRGCDRCDQLQFCSNFLP